MNTELPTQSTKRYQGISRNTHRSSTGLSVEERHTKGFETPPLAAVNSSHLHPSPVNTFFSIHRDSSPFTSQANRT